MSTAVMSPRLELDSFAESALKNSARSWFVVAVAGQFAFAFTVAAFYGLTAWRGGIQAWNRTLFTGITPHPSMSNAAIVGHVVFATIISIAGALQIIPRLRNRFPVFHRWNGRLFLLAAFTQGITGLYLTWGKRLPFGVMQRLPIWISGVVIILCAAMALRYALARDFKTHRRWALRLFLVAGGSWFFRVGFALTVLLVGPVGFDPATFSGPLPTFWAYAEYLLPLAVLELYLMAQERPSLRRRMATAGLLFVLTLATGTGILAVSLGQWAPKVRGAFDSRTSIADTISPTISASGLEAGVAQYHELKTTQPVNYNFDENQLNDLGYKLLHAKKYPEAIRIFQLNVEAYPHSGNTYDSLGEAYMDAGNKPLAIASYQKSLQLNPKNLNGKNMLKQLGSK